MTRELADIIERVYRRGDHAYYLEQSKQQLVLPAAFSEVLTDRTYTVIEFYRAKNCWPCRKWMFRFPLVVKGELEVQFDSTVMISKVVNAFYLQHEFGVKNRADEKITPSLDGFSERPYVKTQFELDERLTTILKHANYTRLTLAMMNEVVCDLSFPKGVTIFGPQVTVEYALFHDLLGICEDN